MRYMTNNGRHMIEMTGIHKSFGALAVLQGVSLTVAKGEVVAIIGPSGSGKSTLLRCLCRLEAIDRGSIKVAGETLATEMPDGRSRYVADAEARRICSRMGMVFQHFNLFPHLTVLDNLLEAPLTVKGLARADILPEAEALLRSMKRTTRLNLAVCDRQGCSVLEFTPKTVVLRRGEEGIGARGQTLDIVHALRQRVEFGTSVTIRPIENGVLLLVEAESVGAVATVHGIHVGLLPRFVFERALSHSALLI